WNDAGKAIRMSGSIRDIDDKKKTEIELTHYQNKLEELVKDRTAELEQERASLLKSNQSLKALSQGNRSLAHAIDEQELLDDICRIIVEVGNYKLAWVGYAVHDENKTIQPIAQYGYEKDYIKNLNLTWKDTKQGQGPAGTALRTSNFSLVNNTMTDPRFVPWRDEAIKRGYGSVASFPLLDESNKAFGVLTIYAPNVNSFDKEEIDLLTELTNNITYGIMALRTKKELIQKERLAVLGKIIATVSHELRNPLGTIRTSLYTISQKLTNKDKVLLEKQLTRAERNVMRCDTIIEELLDFTRSSELHLEITALDNLCDEVLNEYVFPENVKITKEFSSDAIIKIEKEKIRRCLINILNNSCLAMLESENNEIQNPLKLNILTGRSDTKVWIEIIDNGPGIPDSDVNKIFEPLYSTRTYGIGLGLPIVKQIMEQHSGGISIDSKSGSETSVKLWFPL
ncbi:MAG: HAMP domain-containing sensor histidine kinase, partial [Proteobacteria bacterium]|nr:HAMP domain-containing sensor histidine kinase [Pseudomonadota bacterium]